MVEAGYPDKPITIIVPWPPGGASDVIPRTLSKPMLEELKKRRSDTIKGAALPSPKRLPAAQGSGRRGYVQAGIKFWKVLALWAGLPVLAQHPHLPQAMFFQLSGILNDMVLFWLPRDGYFI